MESILSHFFSSFLHVENHFDISKITMSMHDIYCIRIYSEKLINKKCCHNDVRVHLNCSMLETLFEFNISLNQSCNNPF